MSSTAEYLQLILDCLRGTPGVSFRPMMGEYILYFNGKIVGGIYDDRLLVKPTPTALKFLGTPVYEVPYPGGKEMLLVEEFEQEGYLAELFSEMEPELPMPKKKK